MSNRNDGKAEEEFCREVFVTLQEKRKFSFHRLYDTHSAGGTSIIPPQISDFLATFEGMSLAIEVKSSSKHSSMIGVPRSYVRSTQVAKMRLHCRSHGLGIFIFVKAKTKEFEIYDAKDIIAWYRAGNKRQKLGSPIAAGEGKGGLYEELLNSFYLLNRLYL